MYVEPPECLKKTANVPNKLLMGPGPSNSPPSVLQALSQPILGHFQQECFQLMDEVKEGLRYIFQTRNDLTLALSSSGHGGMEAVLCNLLEPGEKALITVNGIWGQRASTMARRYEAVVETLETEIGNNFNLHKIETAISKHKPAVFFIVQGESSTGVFQNIEGIGSICHRYNCLLAVDAVASLGAVPLLTDYWGVDAVYTGSQKVLGAPSGITPISFSKKAVEKIFNRRTPIKVFYLDMTILGDYWNCFGRPRVYHHTISSTLLCGLRESLVLFCREGLDKSIERHQICAERFYKGLHELRLKFLVQDKHKRLPTVTTIKVPEDVDWKDIISYSSRRYSVEIAGGLGPTAGKVLRIGLMGYNASFTNVDFVLKILKESLNFLRNNKMSHL